jgi:PAS domain S-box-containing protein
VRAESEALFRSIGDGAIATDEFGHITRINPKALSILGLTLEEVIGKWFPRLIVIARPDGSPIPLVERPIVRMFLTGKVVSEKAHYKTKDGRLVPVSITVSPIMFDDKPVGAVEVFRDITIENEIDRMKSEFISLASHQLRTPLSTIQTYAHMLDEGFMGKLSSDQTRAIKTIIAATNSMNELISTLLNIARIESGSIAVKSKRLEAAQVASDVLKQLKLSADSKGVTLTLQQPKAPVHLQADALIVKEVLTNLVGNSIKYTTSGGAVTISIRERADDVVFAIRDTGIGIPKQSQDKIFAKFFRAQNVVRQETTGTGLGLYVVKGLVGTLHGKVWFKSEEHVGTTFYISLPKVFHADG